MDIITLMQRLSHIREEHGNLPVELMIDFEEEGQTQASVTDVGVCVGGPGEKAEYVVIIHEEP